MSGTEASSPARSVSRARSKSDREDTVEVTAEYEAFTKELEEFNLQFGVAKGRDPVLGGKRLDLYKIYQWVTEAGGYEQVTSARGWKKIMDPFNLPATCTNSAYVAKQLYQKYLYNYEQFKVHNKPIDVIMQEKRPFDQSSNGNGEDSTAPNSPESKAKRKFGSFPDVQSDTPPLASPAPARADLADTPSQARVKTPPPSNTPAPVLAPMPAGVPVPAPAPAPVSTPTAAPKQASAIATIPGTPAPSTPAPAPQTVVPRMATFATPSVPSTPTPTVARRQFAASEPLHKRLRMMAEANMHASRNAAVTPKPPPPRARAGQIAVNPDDDGRDEKYLYGAWQNRLLLAMASKLPNEVDWAFTKLVKLSYSKNFFLGIVPGALEEMLDHAAPLFDTLELKRENGIIEARPTLGNNVAVFHSLERDNLIERVMQVFHVIRNLSFWPDNAVAFVKNYNLLMYIAKGIAVPPLSHYIEIKHYCLDLLENLSPYLILQGKDDFFLAMLQQLIMEDDQALIIASTETLTRFCSSEANAKVLLEADNAALVRRFLQLLLVPDERMVSAVLDWFYEFSSLGSSACSLIVEAVGYNVLRLFIKFLAWQGFPRKPTHAITHPPGAPAPPQTPVPLRGASASAKAAPFVQPKPGSSGASVEALASGTVVPLGIGADNAPSLPRLNAAEEAQLVSAMQGIEFLASTARGEVGDSSTAAPSAGQRPIADVELPVTCFWRLDDSLPEDSNITGTPFRPCFRRFATDAELFEHLQTDHVPLDAARVTSCRWKMCAVGGEEAKGPWSRVRLLKHIATHLGGNVTGSFITPAAAMPVSRSPVHSANTTAATMAAAAAALAAATGGPSGPEEELKGVPLTAMLVLRNLARVPANRALFAAVEDSLVAKVCADGRFYVLANVLAELNKKEVV
ncbi:Chromatin structure-remodeling complex protein rsc9 [Geranomyces variabilis]|uniref:Chromatin structure-remodeling complex protein rsc9 n=1 Tax=Geranomyces variabilis TaxID=109894 RepID=A0AAD5THF0_9FUNG|nr:Chromatin structure-remodeling complex protein rsc9 [Geranomyces variabilis]